MSTEELPAGSDLPADSNRARALLDRYPVIDGHNDLAWALRAAGSLDQDISASVGFTHTDLPRLAKGGVGAQFWSVYVPAELHGDAAVATTLEQIDLVRQLAERHPTLELAFSAADVRRIMTTGKVAFGGRIRELSNITAPFLNIYGSRDHVAPPDSVKPLTGLVGSNNAAERELNAGHIGLLVGSTMRRKTMPTILDWLDAVLSQDQIGGPSVPQSKSPERVGANGVRPKG